MLNKTTNLSLKLTCSTAFASINYTGLAVPQSFKVLTNTNTLMSSVPSSGIITKNNTSSVSTTRLNAGTINSQHNAVFNSIIPYGEKVSIGRFVLSANSGFKILNKPVLLIKSNRNDTLLTLKETSTLGTFDIQCVSSSSNIRNLEAEIVYKITKVSTLSNIINKISTDSTIIGPGKSTREIKIYGAPNTPFNVFVLDNNDNSIIPNANSSAHTINGIKNCISSTLNKYGYHSHKHKFPGLTKVKTTTVNGDHTDVFDILFSDLTDVAVGDEISTRHSDTVKVIAINVGGNANKCRLSKALTLSNSTKVIFKRGNTYKAHVSTSGSMSSTINQDYPIITFNQYSNPVITIEATDTNVNTRINGGVANTFDLQTFVGKLNKEPREYNGTSIYRVKYVLEGRTFNVKTSGLVASSFVKNSGDAAYEILNISASGSGTTTCTILYEISILKFGVQDTNISLNLNNMVG